jgi:predicted acylesterase/phospholipase RssA
MSSTYPIIFEPIIRNGCAYVDGALINDYPIDDCIRDQKCDPKDILGLKILWECKPTNITEKTSFIQFMTVFVNQIRTNLFENRKTTPIPNEVICMSKEQTIYDWKNIINDENYRRELLARGIMYAKMFLSYRDNYK